MSTTNSLSANLHKAYNDLGVCTELLNKLSRVLNGQRLRFMEVCGTHTVAIFQSGLRGILPPNIEHISGPGCPVCVTHDSEVALFLQLAKNKDIIIATFGDLLRVPGPNGENLKYARAEKGNIEIVYSPLDALKLAKTHPQKEIVFLGVGFETTAPVVAGTIETARTANINNFSVLSFHKLVPPALNVILTEDNTDIDAFLLPGHVAVIIGLSPFAMLPLKYNKPSCVSGFEPVDILLGLNDLALQIVEGHPDVHNAYGRVVNKDGNLRAIELMKKVFEPCDALWRGFGKIKNSGLRLKEEYTIFDTMRKFDLILPEPKPLKGCMCGSVLRGQISPDKCPLFSKICTPANPAGPCMVSTEGSCAAFYKYGA